MVSTICLFCHTIQEILRFFQLPSVWKKKKNDTLARMSKKKRKKLSPVVISLSLRISHVPALSPSGCLVDWHTTIRLFTIVICNQRIFEISSTSEKSNFCNPSSHERDAIQSIYILIIKRTALLTSSFFAKKNRFPCG